MAGTAEGMRRWRAAHPEKVAAANARRRACREQRRSVDAAYRRAHLAERRAWHRAWSKAHPESQTARMSARRARRAGAGGSHTNDEWLAKCQALGNRCVYCGDAGALQRDHVVPLTRGGSDHISNVVPACGPCNASKYNRLLSEWPGRRSIAAGAA